MDMNGEICPKKTNWWAQLDDTFKFYISFRCQFVEHTNAHAHFKSLSTKWWMIMFVVMLAINEING
jgi:hypothetical protein